MLCIRRPTIPIEELVAFCFCLRFFFHTVKPANFYRTVKCIKLLQLKRKVCVFYAILIISKFSTKLTMRAFSIIAVVVHQFILLKRFDNILGGSNGVSNSVSPILVLFNEAVSSILMNLKSSWVTMSCMFTLFEWCHFTAEKLPSLVRSAGYVGKWFLIVIVQQLPWIERRQCIYSILTGLNVKILEA